MEYLALIVAALTGGAAGAVITGLFARKARREDRALAAESAERAAIAAEEQRRLATTVAKEAAHLQWQRDRLAQSETFLFSDNEVLSKQGLNAMRTLIYGPGINPEIRVLARLAIRQKLSEREQRIDDEGVSAGE